MDPKPNLDFLRALAVTCVVVDHTLLAKGVLLVGSWQIAWIGTFGVYLFFVHTCLVLMWSLARRSHSLDFYIRRIFRIYPLAIVAIFAAIVLHAPVAGSPGNWFVAAKSSPGMVATNLLLAQNLFGPLGGNVIGVLWSLPLELDMYIFLPALFFLIREEEALWPILLLWAICVAIARQLFPVSYGNVFGTVIPDFLPGVMAYVGFRKWKPRLPAFVFAPFLLALLFFFMRDPNARRAWPVCLAIGLGLPLFRQFSSAWVVNPAHHIAKYSFGIYLSHPFCIALGIYLLPHQPLGIQLAVELITIAVISVAAYHFLEHPMIRLGSRFAQKIETRYEETVQV